jgi:hypothetical protein
MRQRFFREQGWMYPPHDDFFACRPEPVGKRIAARRVCGKTAYPDEVAVRIDANVLVFLFSDGYGVPQRGETCQQMERKLRDHHAPGRFIIRVNTWRYKKDFHGDSVQDVFRCSLFIS